MKAQEFRLVNYYEYNCGCEKEVNWVLSEIDADDLDYLSRNPDDRDFRAIPITEEWLLKIEQKENSRFTLEKVEGYKGYLACDGDTVLKTILFLHEWQNLYFALKNEELTFKK